MNVLLIFLSLVLLSSSVGPKVDTKLVAPNATCACDLGVHDKLENPNQFNFGTFTGKCIDSCRYRTSKFLRVDEGSEETVLLSNFKHEGKYWRAKVPLNASYATEVGFEEFLPGIHHVFLVFYFPTDAPVVLFPQDRKGRSQTVHTLTLSPEGIPPKQGRYNLFDAYLGRYLTGVRVLSRDDMYNWSVKKLKHKVSMYTLKITPEQIEQLLRYGLQYGDEKSFREIYTLLANNCATNTLDWIDHVLAPKKSEYPIYYGWLYSLERALPFSGPFGTLNVFRSRNLVHSEPKMLN